MDWTHNTIWIEQLPAGEYRRVEYRNTKASLAERPSGSYFDVRGFKPPARCFEGYPVISTATYLELTRSNVHSFVGIRRLGAIKRLELHYCTKLKSDRGLAELSDELEWLHINTSRRFEPTDELARLKNLRVLCLNSCAPLASLGFLRSFPRLLDFRFVDTNVLDGDLNPLFEHPSLLNAAFLNKKHYNKSEREVDEYFKPRCSGQKVPVSKGDYWTYRYKAFGSIPVGDDRAPEA